MASIVLSNVGSSIGNMILPGVGGQVVSSLGRSLGKTLDEKIGLTSSSEGSKLESYKVQDSSYGVSIPVAFGRARIAGNVLWVSDLIETAHGTSLSGKGGAFSSQSTSYTYSLNCAIGLCEGPIGSIQTIWADTKIIYQDGVWTSGVVEGATFYLGTQTQAVDPLLSSLIGAGEVPSYKGLAYVVLEGLQISNFSNRLPNLTFEITPPDVTGEPEWLGTIDPSFYHSIITTRNQGMPPLVLSRSSNLVRRVLLGGYSVSGQRASFVISTYDVTEDVPVLITKVISDDFSGVDVGGQSWAMDENGRFVVLSLQDGAVGKPLSLALYDTETASFGPPVSVGMDLSEARRVIWLDALHVAIMATSNGKRGVRVFLRSGRTLIDKGFFDVWGAGSATSTVCDGYLQFVPFGHGYYSFIVDAAPSFTLLSCRYISWENNILSVGSTQIIASGLDTGDGNGAQSSFLQLDDHEWALFYGTTSDVRLLSFTLSDEGVNLSRAWQQLKNADLGVCLCHAPFIVGNRIINIQRPYYESHYRISQIAVDEDHFSLVVDGQLVPDFEEAVQNFEAIHLGSARYLVSGNYGYGGYLGRLDIMTGALTGSSLDVVVGEILRRVGYKEGDYNLSSLAAVPIDGFVIDNACTAQTLCEQLAAYCPFDLVDKNGILTGVLHGQGEVATVSENNLACDKDHKLKSILCKRAMETSLPIEVSVEYADATRDYEKGSQFARRGVIKNTVHKERLILPLSITPTKAKQVAQDRLYKYWSEQTSYQFALPQSALTLMPSDIVTIEDKRFRITELSLEDSLIRVAAVAAPFGAVSSFVKADVSSVSSVGSPSCAVSYLSLIDGPLLRAKDDEAGFYAAITGSVHWHGAGLWLAKDGVHFTFLHSFETAAIAGVTTSVLMKGPCYYMDHVNSVDVQLINGSLSSSTLSALMGGANAALIGGEVLQFQTATLIGPNLYRLSDFIRGQKGTEDKVFEHAIGESFVLLEELGLKFIPVDSSARGNIYAFRAVSNGGSLDVSRESAMSISCHNLRPLAPVHLKIRKSDQGDLCLSWIRRVRKNGGWCDYIDVPLDEESEIYEVTFTQEQNQNILRRLTLSGLSALVYDVSMQEIDFDGGEVSDLVVTVAQVSSRFGAGQTSTIYYN